MDFGEFKKIDSLFVPGNAGSGAAVAKGAALARGTTTSCRQEEPRGAGRVAAGSGLNAKDTRNGISRGKPSGPISRVMQRSYLLE